MTTKFHLILLFYICSLISYGQTKSVYINFKNDSICKISVTLFGLDTMHYEINNHENITIDFSKKTSVKINLITQNVSLSIDSIQVDIESLSIQLDKKSPFDCKYFIDRKFPIRSQYTDCNGENCKHIIIANDSKGEIPVLWEGEPRAYSKGKKRHYLDGKEMTEEEIDKLLNDKH